jgi:hypothetical protein
MNKVAGRILNEGIAVRKTQIMSDFLKAAHDSGDYKQKRNLIRPAM